MRKFECNYCSKPCVLTFDSTSGDVPRFCPYLTIQPTKWHEVKEDSAENAHTINEQFRNSEQLPKLTVEVFDRPNCPEWAKYAAVNADGSVRVFLNNPTHQWRNYWYDPKSYWEETLEHSDKYDATDWHNSLIERPKKQEQLPDWVKVKEWGYNKSTNQYFIIIDFLTNSIRVNYFPHAFDTFISNKDIIDNCTKARKRSFNEKEMRGLVGKVVTDEDNGNSYLINQHNKKRNDIKFGGEWLTNKDLMKDTNYTIDGKPCFKLEHLENGEWVE